MLPHQQIAWIKEQMKSIALQLDLAHFNAQRVAKKVASVDRFDAFSVVEKKGVNPQVPMG